MKVALVCVTNHNYGSILQTYALQEKVRSMGCKTKIIKYQEPLASKIVRCTDTEYLKTRLKVILKGYANRNIKVNLSSRSKSFEDFINMRLDFSEPFTRLKDITTYIKEFDLVLLGSDQVWHPMNILMNYFTLNFVPDNIIKAAYAPSFGVNTIPNRYEQSYKTFISRFQYLSSREEQGVRLIKELTGRYAELVCDPTMLISSDTWRSKMPKRRKVNGEYIFCYFIGNNKNQREVVKSFSKRMDLKIVSILHIDEFIKYDEQFCDESLYDVNPLGFLQLIDKASFVFTDSFHASVFSILFHKRFWVFDRFESNIKHSTSSRIQSLLNTVKLDSRFVSSTKDFFPDENMGIDYDIVDERINLLKKKSQDYLSSFISNGKEY